MSQKPRGMCRACEQKLIQQLQAKQDMVKALHAIEAEKLPPVPSPVYVVGIIRGGEQYFFAFRRETRIEMLRLVGRWAADPSLSFSWYDASIVSQRINNALKNPVQSLPQVECLDTDCEGI